LAARHIVGSRPLAGRVRVLALVQDYISYIDTPERVEVSSGEARRAWYGPALLGVVARGLEVAVESDEPRE
jgi:hypothetical protein